MSEHAEQTAPIRHLFIDTHKLTAAQRRRLAKRLEQLLGLRYFTGLDQPGDGTATVVVHSELEGVEVTEALVWRLVQRLYKPRLLLDEEMRRLRSLHDLLPPPDLRQETARREDEERRTGLRLISTRTVNAVDVYPLWPDCLNGDDFNPHNGIDLMDLGEIRVPLQALGAAICRRRNELVGLLDPERSESELANSPKIG